MRIFALVLSFGFVTAPTYTAAPPQTNAPSAQLSGRVVDERTGTPVSSARVALVPQPRSAGPIPQTITDQDGRYAFEGVAPGRYRVDVQKSGILPPAESTTVPIAILAAGQIVEGWDVSVRRGGAIAGRILDQFGEPLVDVIVHAMPRNATAAAANPPPPISASSIDHRAGMATNDLGEFRVFGLAPGEYLLSAAPPQRLGFQAISTDTTLLAVTYYPGVADASAAQPITVATGETIGNVEFRLLTAPGFRVSGVVVDEANTPVAGAMVMLRGDPRTGVAVIGPVGQTSSDANGRFVLGNVPSGSYYATAIPVFTTTGGTGIDISVVDDGPRAPGSEPIEVIVSEADVDGLTITVSPAR